MTIELIAIAIAAFVAGIVIAGLIYRRMPQKLKVNKFAAQWKQLQGYCKDKQTWPKALGEAEKLLEKALKKRKFKGKTMGEMMVSAQKIFTDNDGVWFAHNLYKKVAAGDIKKLKETDIKDALVAYRQALRDLGALQQ